MPDELRSTIAKHTEDGHRTVMLDTERGSITSSWYEADGATAAVAYVGGVGGDLDSPARGLYPRLCEDLRERGLAGLRVQFRDPLDLDEATYDLLAGIAFLAETGVTDVGLVGHSFGGAVAIRAATIAEEVRTVVTLATQGYGADVVCEFAPGVSVLLLHGEADAVLPWRASQHVFDIAHQPKHLAVLSDAGHGLDEAADEVYGEVRAWLLSELAEE